MPSVPVQLCDRQFIQNAAENENDLVRVVDQQSVLVTVGMGVVECCDHETGAWRAVDTLHSPDGHIIPGLSAGHTYSFRVDGGQHLPAVTIPHESRWQQEQFERRYQELHIIGQGQTAVVKLAEDRGTGQRVAIKEVDRRKTPQLLTRAEYSFLTALNHSSIVRGLAMFENAPSPGVDTIVMELLQGEDVLIHACSMSSVSEAYIRRITSHLLSALDYLQLQQIAHCDIVPDNLLVEDHNNQLLLKIVDFGSACGINQKRETIHYKPSLFLDLEFSAPELLEEVPCPALTTDMWNCAVLVYVLLSGVSPFLDDSPEETVAHVLNVDFSYPPELFPSESTGAQEFVSSLLVRDPASRPLAHTALSMPWLQQTSSTFDVSPTLLVSFVSRRKPQSMQHNFGL